MTRVRRLLGPLAALCLFWQIGTVTSVPGALWMSADDPHAAVCSCGHEAGATCPMHHKPTGRPSRCTMQAANASEAAVLTTLVGIVGVIAERTASIRPADPLLSAPPSDVSIAGERPVPPDPPPPRA